MEASVLVPSQGNNPEGKTHSRSLECDSGQAFQTQSSDSNRVVPISAAVQSLCSRWIRPQVDLFATRFNHKLPHFIALIHPIQWTIALPVGATGPAKRQKKTSCIYYRQDRSQSVHSPGGASYFISCLPLDVIASFSFGAKECAEEFLQRYVFEVLQRTLPSFVFFISTE